jgi:hypothetical protein
MTGGESTVATAGSFALGGWRVNRVGYGAMQLTGDIVFGPPRDRDEALRVLRAAIESGINHIDTAQDYGPAVVNELIREALYPYPADLAIVSKVAARRDEAGAVLADEEPDERRAGLEENLVTLGLDRLAAVNLRLMDGARPGERFDAQLAALSQARDEGLIDGHQLDARVSMTSASRSSFSWRSSGIHEGNSSTITRTPKRARCIRVCGGCTIAPMGTVRTLWSVRRGAPRTLSSASPRAAGQRNTSPPRPAVRTLLPLRGGAPPGARLREEGDQMYSLRQRVGMVTLTVSAAAVLTAGASSGWAKPKPVSHKMSMSMIAGTWSGQYSGGYNGTFTLHWTQTGSKLTGTIKLSSPSGTYGVNGSVQGSAIKFGAVGVGASYTGSVSGSGKSMSGTYLAVPKGGSWSATKTP